MMQQVLFSFSSQEGKKLTQPKANNSSSSPRYRILHSSRYLYPWVTRRKRDSLIVITTRTMRVVRLWTNQDQVSKGLPVLRTRLRKRKAIEAANMAQGKDIVSEVFAEFREGSERRGPETGGGADFNSFPSVEEWSVLQKGKQWKWCNRWNPRFHQGHHGKRKQHCFRMETVTRTGCGGRGFSICG